MAFWRSILAPVFDMGQDLFYFILQPNWLTRYPTDWPGTQLTDQVLYNYMRHQVIPRITLPETNS